MAVKKRDHFTCIICEQRGIELHSHHLNSWDVYIDERFDLDNGVCLCRQCHENFHEIYGKGNNTSVQFEEYKQFCRSIIKHSEKQVKLDLIVKEITDKLKKDCST